MMHVAPNSTQSHADVDLELLFGEQADARACYELALTYSSFGFRDKAVIEFYRLSEQRTASAEHYATLLTPKLFH